jgi:DNA adenine methylase
LPLVGTARPFVKWVGGKGQLLPELISRTPESFKTYYESFVGGGALFFALQPERAVLSDVNHELINCYQVVRDHLPGLLKDLKKHVYEKDYYYEIRELDRKSSFARMSKIKRASRLIYLNKTCFNGLYRVNSKGHFNVPLGSYTNPTICDEDNLKRCRAALLDADILDAKFTEVQKQMVAGDFAYFDPPYVPLNDTAYFTSYSKDGFGPEDQVELAAVCRSIDKRGVMFMASNSDTPYVRELYSGFRVEKVFASRMVNSKADRRGKIAEVIITNY